MDSFFGSGGGLGLAEKGEILRTQLGMAAGMPLIDIVAQAEADLGLAEEKSLNMVQRMDRCLGALGVAPTVPTAIQMAAVPMVAAQPMMPVPMGMVVEAVVMERVDEPMLRFSAVNNTSFDQNGVLYAIGTNWGQSAYANPADSAKVRMSWSGDAANYYSTAGGHKQGDARQAASVICAHTHPGRNATMWSRGAPGAWFGIDLLEVSVLPTHFAYRNDFGGGNNHPRTFELQGSIDGTHWITLSSHKAESWSGKSAKAWPIVGCEQFFRHFRILNQGTPNHLCCSGLEIYGRVRGAPPNYVAAAPTQPVATASSIAPIVAIPPRTDGLISTQDISGCWICCCFPLMWWALFRKEATGPDTLKHAGWCVSRLLPRQTPSTTWLPLTTAA